MIRVADYLIKLLEDKGVRDVFTVSGGGSIYLCDALAQSEKIQYHCCHHEQAVAYAAEGYARKKTSLGVSMVTTGPGATNSISGACSAWIDSVPLLFISGQVFLNQTILDSPLRQLVVQEINIIDLVKPITKYAVMITEKNTIKYHLHKAIHCATTGRTGPAWIDVPADIQMAMIDPSEIKDDFEASELQHSPDPDFQVKVQQSADLLKRSKRPLMLAGH